MAKQQIFYSMQQRAMELKNTIRQWGTQGKALVFLHYFGGAAESWQWVAEALAKDYRCFAIDLPGFGKAAPLDQASIAGFANFVQRELAALRLDAYTLIGHSMGAKIAMQVAVDAANKAVQHLILLAPSPPTTEPMAAEEKERMLRHPDRQVAENTLKGAIKKSLTAEQQKLAIETQLVIDEDAWRWWLLEGMDHSIAEQVKSLEIPITVLASEDDPVITPAVIAQRVMQELKGASLINTSKVGHLIPLEAPDWVAQQIRNVVAAGKVSTAAGVASGNLLQDIPSRK